jgi:hypothetical protein
LEVCRQVPPSGGKQEGVMKVKTTVKAGGLSSSPIGVLARP